MAALKKYDDRRCRRHVPRQNRGTGCRSKQQFAANLNARLADGSVRIEVYGGLRTAFTDADIASSSDRQARTFCPGDL